MVKHITILLAEAALEPFPKELMKNFKVKKYFARISKKPDEVLLDITEHNFLIRNLANSHKRGRPDITHLALLACQGSIIAKRKQLSVIVHTYNDFIIYIKPETRIPRTLRRFKGLFAQLFEFNRVPPNEQEDPLIYLEKGTLTDFLKKNRYKHDLIIEFSVKGEKKALPSIAKAIINSSTPLLIFGAFQRGHIKTLPRDLIDKTISIFEEGLDLFTVISHVLTAVEYEEEFQQEKTT